MVSPVILGGADAQGVENVLRPSSLRGALRFWTRALAGDDFRQLEARLWGDADRHGQRTKVLTPPAFPGEPKRRPLFPGNEGRRRSFTSMYEPVRNPLILRFHMADQADLPRLQAVVWAWLHLGTVGRRSRRGYGAFTWVPTPGDLLSSSGLPEFNEQLTADAGLCEHLKTGLERVRELMGAGQPTKNPRTTSPWFRLTTIDQIFVGKKQSAIRYDDENRLGDLMHGLRKRGAHHKELGASPGDEQRLASPMIWRVLPVRGGFAPILTWSPLEIATLSEQDDAGMYQYLQRTLGFSQSLLGTPLFA